MESLKVFNDDMINTLVNDIKPIKPKLPGEVRTVGYARVSTMNQHLEDQTTRLSEFIIREGYKPVGDPAIISEKFSGAKNKRAGRDKIIEMVKNHEIDLVVVTKIDRWARSLPDLIDTLQLMNDHEVEMRFIDQNFDVSTSIGKLTLYILGAIAEFERSIILDRMQEGLMRAKLMGSRSGKPLHRPRIELPDKKIITDYKAGATINQLAERFKVSDSTVRNRLIANNIKIRSWKA